MTPNDRLQVLEAVDHLNILEQHRTVGDLSVAIVSDAIAFRLAAAIEALSKTSPEFRNLHFGETWQLMWAVRNRITHAYAHIDTDAIARTVTTEVPSLHAQLLNLLSD